MPWDYGWMMVPKKLMTRLLRGSIENVSFTDLSRLVEAMGFELRRVTGSHHIYRHPHIPERLNLQSQAGQAKPYQIRQFLALVQRYALRMKERP